MHAAAAAGQYNSLADYVDCVKMIRESRGRIEPLDSRHQRPTTQQWHNKTKQNTVSTLMAGWPGEVGRSVRIDCESATHGVC